MTKKTQENPETARFHWLPVTLHSGRGEVRGEAAVNLQNIFSLEPGVAKWMAAIFGPQQQLSVLRSESPLSILRKSLAADEIDWDEVDRSDEAQDALRIIASPTEIRILMDSARGAVRLSFPEWITRTDLLDFKSDVILVISGLMVEFWNMAKWREFLQTTAEKRAVAIDTIQTLRK